MIAFYVFCGLSFMAKGIPGFRRARVGRAVLLIGCNRWSLLFTGRLRVALGALALSTLSLPWFVAMYVRHGRASPIGCLIHDHLNRLTSGVHGDTGSIGTSSSSSATGHVSVDRAGAAGAGAARAVRLRGCGTTQGRRRPTALSASAGPRSCSRCGRVRPSRCTARWSRSSTTMISGRRRRLALTLVGVLLDAHARSRRLRSGGALRPLVVARADWARWRFRSLLGVGGLARQLCVACCPPTCRTARGALWVFRPRTRGCTAGAAVDRARRRRGACAGERAAARRARPEESDAADRMLGAGLFAAATVCAFVGRDLSLDHDAAPGRHERLIQLFVYNYERPFPAQFDYRPAFSSGFAIVARARC